MPTNGANIIDAYEQHPAPMELFLFADTRSVLAVDWPELVTRAASGSWVAASHRASSARVVHPSHRENCEDVDAHQRGDDPGSA
jgi:hypothetical protein